MLELCKRLTEEKAEVHLILSLYFVFFLKKAAGKLQVSHKVRRGNVFV